MKGAQNIGDIEKIINLIPDEMNDSQDYEEQNDYLE
jgi:hypothetical protein